MSRLKTSWLVFLVALCFSMPLWAQISHRSDVDLRRDWLHQRSLLSHDELVQCKAMRLQGEEFGKYAFEQEAPNCAMLSIKGAYMSRALDEARMFQPLPKIGFPEACYRSGWLNAYLVAYDALGPSCEARLTAEAQANLEKRIQHCESLGDAIVSDSMNWSDFFSGLVESQSRADARVLLANMISLVQVGRSGAAWDLMIKSQQNELFGSLPCNAAIAMKLRK